MNNPETAPDEMMPAEAASSTGRSLGADMIYGLEDRPPVRESIFAAIQLVFACFVGILPRH